jgi:hypothetical protein
VRPCQRPKRQNEAKTTTQLLWRARMLKLQRAGMVSTKRLLAITPIEHHHYTPESWIYSVLIVHVNSMTVLGLYFDEFFKTHCTYLLNISLNFMVVMNCE